jgi:hypothetical protein
VPDRHCPLLPYSYAQSDAPETSKTMIYKRVPEKDTSSYLQIINLSESYIFSFAYTTLPWHRQVVACSQSIEIKSQSKKVLQFELLIFFKCLVLINDFGVH